jgi:hypothetical protein
VGNAAAPAAGRGIDAQRVVAEGGGSLFGAHAILAAARPDETLRAIASLARAGADCAWFRSERPVWPSGVALLFWLRQHMPRTAEKVLARSRQRWTAH